MILIGTFYGVIVAKTQLWSGATSPQVGEGGLWATGHGEEKGGQKGGKRERQKRGQEEGSGGVY